jgi:hypothetical protein
MKVYISGYHTPEKPSNHPGDVEDISLRVSSNTYIFFLPLQFFLWGKGYPRFSKPDKKVPVVLNAYLFHSAKFYIQKLAG